MPKIYCHSRCHIAESLVFLRLCDCRLIEIFSTVARNSEVIARLASTFVFIFDFHSKGTVFSRNQCSTLSFLNLLRSSFLALFYPLID